jgi:hypothetical protein
MAMNPIPPQAYTKDSLLKAYSWLQNQDSSIKEMATTPDILVSLYLKATRDGDAVLDRPSIQNFKHELKQLAGMMGEFEKEIIEEKIQKEQNKPQASAAVAADPLSNPLSQAFVSAGLEKAMENFNSQSNPVSFMAPVAKNNAENVNKKGDVSLLNGLDAKSLVLISEIKTNLNLSSDLEALKFLIQTGYNRAKKLF